MELRHLTSFLILCETMHFGQASQRLHIVQPALTKQIKELEQSLGVQLFLRDKRNVALTHEGNYFRQRCKSILQQIEDSKTEIKWINQGIQGEIKIGYVGSCIHTFLPELLDKIASTYPNIHWYLNELTSIAQEKELKEGNLDIAFLRNPISNTDFESKIVFQEPFAIVLPTKHGCTLENFEGMHLLKDEKYILPSRNDGQLYHEIQLSICQDAGFSPNIVHESVHGHTVMKMVEHDFGVTILPLSFMQFANEKIKFIPLTNIRQRSEISMMWKKSNRNPTLQKLVELVDEMI